ARRADLLSQSAPALRRRSGAAGMRDLRHARRPRELGRPPPLHLAATPALPPGAPLELHRRARPLRPPRLVPALLLRLLPPPRHQRPPDQDSALAHPRHPDRLLHRPAALAQPPPLRPPQPLGADADGRPLRLRHGRAAGGPPPPGAGPPPGRGGA